MRGWKKLVLGLTLATSATIGFASPTAPVNNEDYRTFAQQPVDSAGKVEVIEFFWYDCPHCFVLDPLLSQWVSKQGSAISFRRVPVQFEGRPFMVLEQTMFYTLEAMGKLEALHGKIFQAVHQDHVRLWTEDAILDFLAKQGIDRQQYLAVSKSFSVVAKVKRASVLQNSYNFDGVPALVVDGKYLTAPWIVGEKMPGASEAQTSQAALQVMDYLVTRATEERKRK